MSATISSCTTGSLAMQPTTFDLLDDFRKRSIASRILQQISGSLRIPYSCWLNPLATMPLICWRHFFFNRMTSPAGSPIGGAYFRTAIKRPLQSSSSSSTERKSLLLEMNGRRVNSIGGYKVPEDMLILIVVSVKLAVSSWIMFSSFACWRCATRTAGIC